MANKLKHNYDMMIVGPEENGGLKAVTIWGDEGLI